MKLSALLLCLLCNIQYSFAQFEYWAENDNETIKKAKVKTLFLYYFQNKTDSILFCINNYDSLGGLVSAKTFARDGSITGVDTFIHDQNHYLIKIIDSDVNKIRSETVIKNNSSGKPIAYQTIINDTTSYSSINHYDENGRFIKSITYDNKGDTMIVTTFYNQRGLMIKNIFTDKQNGTIIINTDYDSSGKLLNRIKTDSVAIYISEFKYDSHGKNYEIKTTIISKKKKTVSKTEYIYYPNGLTF